MLEIEPVLGIVQMFTHVGNLIKLYGAACLLYQFLVSYYLLLIHFPSKSKIMCALSLIFEPVSVFFQFISFYIIKQLFNWSVVFCRGIVVDQIRDLFAGLSWLFSPGECLNVSTVTLTSVPLRPGDGITSQQAGSTSGAPVEPLSRCLHQHCLHLSAHNGTHFRNIHKILAAEKLKRMPFSLRQWLALILMSPDLLAGNSVNQCNAMRINEMDCKRNSP